MAGAVVASLAIGLPALRIRGLALAIITLAFAFAASRWLFLQPWLVPQVSGIPLRDARLLRVRHHPEPPAGHPRRAGQRSLWWPSPIASASSALGRSLRMVAHDEEVASGDGIGVPAHKLLAFSYAAACAGLAGAFTVISIGRVGPQAFPVGQGGAVPVGRAARRARARSSPRCRRPPGSPPSLSWFRGLGHYIDLIGPLSILAVVIASPAGLNGLDQKLHHAG